MTEVVFYKNQLENLVHVIRSPLVVLSLACDSLMTLSRDKHLTINSDKADEYKESLDLIQSSIKRINETVSEIQKNIESQ